MAGGLVLGPVVFQAFEVPERLRFGGKQRLAVHLLPGGGRVVDAMGADEGPLSWSGVFSGTAAASRVMMLDGMRQAGVVVPLSWSGWRYTVVIEAFEVEAMNPAWMPYRLQVCVVAVGDRIAAEALPVAATIADAVALGAGPGIDRRIGAASVNLQSSEPGTFITASGTLAQLVTATALFVAGGGNVS